MNIDYSSIIEKADRRRAALQNIEGLVKTLREQVNVLRDAKIYAGMLAGAWGALDEEGRTLVPTKICNLLNDPKVAYIQNALTQYESSLEEAK